MIDVIAWVFLAAMPIMLIVEVIVARRDRKHARINLGQAERYMRRMADADERLRAEQEQQP